MRDPDLEGRNVPPIVISNAFFESYPLAPREHRMTHKLTRRGLLRTASVACASAAGAWHCLGAPGSVLAAVDQDLDVGRHLYKSLKWNMVKLSGTIQEKFAVLKSLGYDGVELDSPGGIDATEAVAASQSVGLPIEGVVNSTHWRIRHSDPDPAIRQQAMANMRQAMHYAKAVGANSVLLVPGKVNDRQTENHQQVWQRSIEAITDLTPLADQLQMQILIENVGNGFCESPELLAKYIDEIGHPLVGVHFDIGNHIRISPPGSWIRVLGKRIKKLDVKDRTATGEKRLIGEGDADWPDVRRALKEIGYRGWAAAEVSGGQADRLGDVLQRMNRVLGESDGHPQATLG